MTRRVYAAAIITSFHTTRRAARRYAPRRLSFIIARVPPRADAETSTYYSARRVMRDAIIEAQRYDDTD